MSDRPQLFEDVRDLLDAFDEEEVVFVVVGAHALAAHGHVRATKDLDVWVRADPANAPRVLSALGEFGAPLHDLTSEDLAGPGVVFQIGVPPVRIDVVTSIDGVSFEDAWPARLRARFDDIEVGNLGTDVMGVYVAKAVSPWLRFATGYEDRDTEIPGVEDGRAVLIEVNFALGTNPRRPFGAPNR